jgi:hypothetical protein
MVLGLPWLRHALSKLHDSLTAHMSESQRWRDTKSRDAAHLHFGRKKGIYTLARELVDAQSTLSVCSFYRVKFTSTLFQPSPASSVPRRCWYLEAWIQYRSKRPELVLLSQLFYLWHPWVLCQCAFVSLSISVPVWTLT